MAALLMDEKLIRNVWSAYGSWKWYFDEYLCDIGFYSEKFSKMRNCMPTGIFVEGLEFQA